MIKWMEGKPYKIEGDYWVVIEDSEEYKLYKKCADKQLEQWVAGNPIHNWNPEFSECTPDFSCCDKSKLWPKELRIQFLDASYQDRESMLFSSIRLLCEQENVHLVGGPTIN